MHTCQLPMRDNAKAEKPLPASHASGSKGLSQADWLGPTLLPRTRVYGRRRTLLCGGRCVLRDLMHPTTFHNVDSKIGDCTKRSREKAQPTNPSWEVRRAFKKKRMGRVPSLQKAD
jgi:hypothetical protein